MAVPACKLEIPDDLNLMLYESHLQAMKDEQKKGLSNALEAYENLLAKQDNHEERMAIDTDLNTL